MTPRIGSLCSGYGGLDQGVQSVLGGRTVWVSDIDKGANKILAHRYPDVPNLGDFTVTDWSTVEPIEVLTAGYPCQPFSGNGRREGAEDERHLWPYVMRAIRDLRPRLVVLENVEDHLTLGFGSVLSDLAEARFDAEWCVLRASDVGAAHGRPRLFIVAADAGRLLHAATEPRVLAQPLRPEPTPASAERLAGIGARDHADEIGTDCTSPAAYGDYSRAVARWERIMGRRAPAPLVRRAGDDDINPGFVEWLMGLSEGWVTDVPGLTVSEQLKALGNGVCPQQCEAALRSMLGDLEVAA